MNNIAKDAELRLRADIAAEVNTKDVYITYIGGLGGYDTDSAASKAQQRTLNASGFDTRVVSSYRWVSYSKKCH